MWHAMLSMAQFFMCFAQQLVSTKPNSTNVSYKQKCIGTIGVVFQEEPSSNSVLADNSGWHKVREPANRVH